jgi:hypothetical protein
LIEALTFFRHGWACPGHPRASGGGSFTGLPDARIKSGHDEIER